MIESIFNFIPGGSEWIIVIVAAGVLLFGAKKIPELAKTFGKAKGEYKKGEIAVSYTHLTLPPSDLV